MLIGGNSTMQSRKDLIIECIIDTLILDGSNLLILQKALEQSKDPFILLQKIDPDLYNRVIEKYETLKLEVIRKNWFSIDLGYIKSGIKKLIEEYLEDLITREQLLQEIDDVLNVLLSSKTNNDT